MSNRFTVSGHVADPLQMKQYPATVTVEDGRIAAVEPCSDPPGRWILPGFVDAHIHIESSMLVPTEFARTAGVHGTVANVCDPHEIANVLGEEGVRFMITQGQRSPMKFFFGVPSCVPATPFETSGAQIGPAEAESLFGSGSAFFLGEVMNIPGVLQQDQQLLELIRIAARHGRPVDGHAPGLRGEQLQRYIDAGITTDHECFTAEEALEKLNRGMWVQIREGSAARNFDALIDIVDQHWEHCMFCSDDRHPDDLQRGHINLLVKRGLERGIDIMKLLRAACVNPVLHYNLPVGLLRPGDPADFIVVNGLEELQVEQVYIEGELVADQGVTLLPELPVTPLNEFNTAPKKPGQFLIPAQEGAAHVIRVQDGELVTANVLLHPAQCDGAVTADPEQDILFIAVVNRYSDQAPAVALVQGFGLQKGAIASSVAHDSHNIIAVGCDSHSLAAAVNEVIRCRGGIAVFDGKRVHSLPLPVAGIISDRPCAEVAAAYHNLEEQAIGLGATLQAPFMTLSFMGLLVIPSLKISDLGLFDGETFEFVRLFDGAGAGEV